MNLSIAVGGGVLALGILTGLSFHQLIGTELIKFINSFEWTVKILHGHPFRIRVLRISFIFKLMTYQAYLKPTIRRFSDTIRRSNTSMTQQEMTNQMALPRPINGIDAL